MDRGEGPVHPLGVRVSSAVARGPLLLPRGGFGNTRTLAGPERVALLLGSPLRPVDPASSRLRLRGHPALWGVVKSRRELFALPAVLKVVSALLGDST